MSFCPFRPAASPAIVLPAEASTLPLGHTGNSKWQIVVDADPRRGRLQVVLKELNSIIE